jgi:hypothetical protein
MQRKKKDFGMLFITILCWSSFLMPLPLAARMAMFLFVWVFGGILTVKLCDYYFPNER